MGFDIHRVVQGRKLVLGGLRVPWDNKGLAGHSDADVVFHAITDALLGAMGAGDLGTYFPDTDLRWRNATSEIFLAKTLELAQKRAFQVGNVDVTVIAEEPKLGAYHMEIRRSIARRFKIEPDRVNVKAKTMEKLGPIGAGEAIACYAVVSLL